MRAAPQPSRLRTPGTRCSHDIHEAVALSEADPVPRRSSEPVRRGKPAAPRPAGLKAGRNDCGVSYEEGEALWEGWSVTV